VDSGSLIATAGNSDSVTLGSGAATVVDGLKYIAVASGASTNTDGNLLSLHGTLTANLLKFSTGSTASGALGAAADVSAAGNLDQAVFLADSGTANAISWFQYGGNTYVEHAGAAAGTADDKVVELTGVIDLSAATVTTGANGSLLFA
jgi:hypothetical protein